MGIDGTLGFLILCILGIWEEIVQKDFWNSSHTDVPPDGTWLFWGEHYVAQSVGLDGTLASSNMSPLIFQ